MDTIAPEPAVMALGDGPDGEDLLGIAARLAEISLTAADFTSLFERVAGVVRDVLGPVQVGIDLHMQDGDYLQLMPGSFGASAQTTWSSQFRVDDPLAPSARVMRSGRGMTTASAAALAPELAGWWRALGIRQLLSVVLPGAQRRIGVLHVANPPTTFTAGDLALLEQISPFLAAAIEHAVRRIVMDRNERLTAALFRVASEVSAGRSLVELSAVELPEFCAASHIDVFAITFAGEARPRVMLRHGMVDDATVADLLRESTMPRTAPSLIRVQSSGIGVVGVSRAHFPVLVAGGCQASLSLLRRPGSPFSADELKAILRLSAVVALSWAMESYRQDVERRARADERHRIANDLHDHVAQTLFGAELSLHSMVEGLASPDADLTSVRAGVIRARDLLIRGEMSLRERMNGLLAQSPGGWCERLGSVAHDVEEEFGVAIRVMAPDDGGALATDVPPAVAGAVLRAVREGLVNAAKHAQPCRIDVDTAVEPDGILVVTVRDDGGADLDLDHAGHGLSAVRRMLGDVGGSLRVQRKSGSVTEFEVRVPLLR